MLLTPVERLILLKLTHVLELVDPANAEQHNADAQALELGTPRGIAAMFDQIDLEPADISARPRPTLSLVYSAE